MKAIGVRAEQKGRTHGRYRPAQPDKPESPCQLDAVHTWDYAVVHCCVTPNFPTLREIAGSPTPPIKLSWTGSNMAPSEFKYDRWFPSDYLRARGKAVDVAGGTVESHVHPSRGPSKEELATNVALLGSHHATNVLVSGTPRNEDSIDLNRSASRACASARFHPNVASCGPC